MSSDEPSYEVNYDSDCTITLDDSSDEEVVEEEIVECNEGSYANWSELPPLAVEKIYTFLNRKDQTHMSLVCRKWSQEYGSPSVWRKMTFYISEEKCSLDTCPKVRFVRKYGNMIHHVDIICKRFRWHYRTVWQHLKLFLQALTSYTQLSTVAFINMNNYLKHLDNEIHDDIFRIIINFLMSQNKLNSLEFRNSQFNTLEAIEVLSALSNRSNGKLKNLMLEGFISEGTNNEITLNITDAPANIRDMPSDFDTLMNLQTLTVDYSQIFETIINSCFEYAYSSDLWHKIGTLEMIKINCSGSKRINYQGISPAAWGYFAKKCPKLRIDLLYDAGSNIKNTVDVFVVPQMPIRYLYFKWNRANSTRSSTEIGYLLRHLLYCGINGFLEELIVVWSQSTTNFDQDLINFLQYCQKLKVLQLYIQHPVITLDNVFEFWLERGIMSLEVVHVNVTDIPSEEVISYTSLSDYYAPILQVYGLTLLLLADPCPLGIRWRIN